MTKHFTAYAPKAQPVLDWMVRSYQKFESEFQHGAHPEHPASRLGKVIAQERKKHSRNAPFISDEILRETRHALKHQAVEFRARKDSAFIGSCDTGINKKKIKEIIQGLTRDGDKKVPAKEFERRLFHIFGAVFTGHPVFGMNPQLAGAMSRYFSHLSGAKNYPGARKEMHEALNLAFKPADIDGESAQSLEAISNFHSAIKEAEKIAIAVARKEYPQDWTKIDYMPATVATWIPFDWDGRNDITWLKVMEKRAELQIIKFQEDLIPAFQALGSRLKGREAEEIANLTLKMRRTVSLMEKHRDFYKNYDQKEDAGLEILDEQTTRFVNEAQQGDRITHPADLIKTVERLLKNAKNENLKAELVLLRSRLRNHGISQAQVHFRINSQSVLAALSEKIKKELGVDIEINPEESSKDVSAAKSLDAALRPHIEKLLRTARPVGNSVETLLQAKRSLDKQLATISLVVKHMDSHNPIRLLQSETRHVSTILGILATATKYGVDRHIDISGLTEDEVGVERTGEIETLLGKNTHFHEHVSAKRPHECVPYRAKHKQYGFSDSGRYMSQLAAGAYMALANGRSFEAHSTSFSKDVVYAPFLTGGESAGRGAMQSSVPERLAYRCPKHLLQEAQRKGFRVKCEESFQGQDGFMKHGTPESSLSYLAQAMDYLTSDHTKIAKDPYITHKADMRAFAQTMRDTHLALSKDQDYIAFMATMTTLLPPTGSRPVKRQRDDGGQLDLPRAIPHNAVLEQMDLPGTIVYGLGKAIEKNTDTYNHLMQASEEFQLRFGITTQAMKRDPYIMAAYVETILNPAAWRDAARLSKGPERKACHEIAKHLEEVNFYSRFSRISGILIKDFETAKEHQRQHEKKKTRSQKSGETMEGINHGILHALRLAEMRELYQLAVRIKSFSPGNDTNREKLLHNALRCDPTVITELSAIFPKANGHSAKKDNKMRFGEPNEFEDAQDYSELHREVIGPMDQKMRVIRDITDTLFHFNGYVG